MSSEVTAGWNSQVIIEGDQVFKTTLAPYASQAEAIAAADELEAYNQALLDQPIQHAPLTGIDVVQSDSGYHVEHRYDRVHGTPLSVTPEDLRHTALEMLIGQVALMDTVSGPDTLLVPIDLHANNVLVEPDGNPILVDISPPLNRSPDGSFPRQVFSREQDFAEWKMGTKTGAINTLLATTTHGGPTRLSDLPADLMTDYRTYQSLLSQELDPVVRRSVERELQRHFVPYTIRAWRSKHSGK